MRNLWDLPSITLKSYWENFSRDIMVPLSQVAENAGYAALGKMIQKMIQDGKSKVINPTHFLWDNTRCLTMTAQGEPVYKDASHLRPFFVKHDVTFLDALILKKEENTGKKNNATSHYS